MGLLCRSQAATAVCALTERSKLLDHDNPRLPGCRHQSPQAVTLPMLTKRQKDPPKPKPKPKSEPKPEPVSEARPSLPNSALHNDLFQVVVMRVSIHCEGCAGKVRKHISKMEGVTSFSIDVESKRVIVMGRVSPAGVLQSISKVKKAEFWSSHAELS